MPQPYPPKVRENVIRQYEMGLSQSLICILEGISPRCCAYYIKRWKEDKTILTDAEMFGDDRGRPPVITGDDLLGLCAKWASDPTQYIDEVADKLSAAKGRRIPPSTLRYWVKILKITRKKLWKVCGLYIY